MAKGTVKIFTIFSIIFFICLIGWFAFRVSTIRSGNLSAAEQSYKIIQGELSVLHKIGLGFDAETLRERFTDLNRRHPPLRALIIYSETGGCYFLKADQAGLLSRSGTNSFKELKDPAYTVGPGRFLLLRSKLPFPTDDRNDIRVDALYEVLGPQDLYPPLQISLILLATFLVITGVLLAALKGKSPEHRSTPAQAAVSPEEPPALAVERVPTDKEKVPETDSTQISKLYSPASGLVWQNFLNERLDNELKRAASFDQDLILGIIRISGAPSGIGPKVIGELILERFPFSDLAFEYGDNAYAVIIPNTDLDQGITEFEALISELNKLSAGGSSLISAVGLTSRNGRLLNAERLIKEADRALKKAESEKKSTIFAFRADPAKYREFIASRI